MAEAGVNHNGQLQLAKQLIDAAKTAGCDAVKFQTFRSERLVSKKAQLAAYQKRHKSNNEQNQWDLIKRLELSWVEFKKLKEYCQKKKILFVSTPFDFESVDLLEKLNVPFLKISSGEVTNLPFLKYIAQKGRPVILSTGMSTLKEVEEAVKVIVQTGNKNLVLLHCVTEYPAPVKEINLRAMLTLQKAFHFPVGYSDHTLGIEVAVAAVALGARVIEKHLTLDRHLPGPDHRASLMPSEFQQMVMAIRNVEKALGDGIKRPASCEVKNLPIVRKSITAAEPIFKGELITSEKVTLKRPGYGLAPKFLPDVIGKRAAVNIAPDEPIQRKLLV